MNEDPKKQKKDGESTGKADAPKSAKETQSITEPLEVSFLVNAILIQKFLQEITSYGSITIILSRMTNLDWRRMPSALERR